MKKDGPFFKGPKKNLKSKEFGKPSKSRRPEIAGKQRFTPRNEKNGPEAESAHHVGIFHQTLKAGNKVGFLSPCHRKDYSSEIMLDSETCEGLEEGDVVVYSVSNRYFVKIHQRLGHISSPKIFSLMAIHSHHIPHVFPKETVALAEKMVGPTLENRRDLRTFDLVTIDGEDARDFDDAVWAEADPDPRNPNGWRVLVAIADVSYYVKSGDALDTEAYKRGNSVYFPDIVVPMLPEALSNELCSLKPNVDRACLAVEMIISEHGKIKSQYFKRGLMKSRARLTYNQVQKAIDGEFDKTTEPLWQTVIQPLYGAYKSLLKAREKRGTLELNVVENRVILDKDGNVTSVEARPRHESHQLIEELMIAANVAAAKTLKAKGWPCVYRIHDVPDMARIENLKKFLKSFKINTPKAKKYTGSQFNEIIGQTLETPYSKLVNDLILRCQSQARYAVKNIGHFGLSLVDYCHFTSPIRRYADLVVHRALVAALDLGEGGLTSPDPTPLETACDHTSSTERQAAVAEREAMDRFMTAYLVPHIGEEFTASIVGVTGMGLFVSVVGSGAQGFLPKSSLYGDSYVYDAEKHRLFGYRTKSAYQLGDILKVTLNRADPITCNTIFHLSREKFEPKYKKGTNKKKRNDSTPF